MTPRPALNLPSSFASLSLPLILNPGVPYSCGPSRLFTYQNPFSFPLSQSQVGTGTGFLGLILSLPLVVVYLALALNPSESQLPLSDTEILKSTYLVGI